MGLYPRVCKYFKSTVGHPTIHLECGDIPVMLAKEGLVLALCATSAGILSSDAAIQVWWWPDIISMQEVRIVGVLRALLLRDEIGEGSDHHQSCRRSAASCRAQLSRTQNSRML